MTLSRTLALAATAAALTVAPLTVATAADASAPYSVSVEHCNGGIAIQAYPSHRKAVHARNKAVHQQRHHRHTLRTVQLRHGSKLITSSTATC